MDENEQIYGNLSDILDEVFKDDTISESHFNQNTIRSIVKAVIKLRKLKPVTTVEQRELREIIFEAQKVSQEQFEAQPRFEALTDFEFDAQFWAEVECEAQAGMMHELNKQVTKMGLSNQDTVYEVDEAEINESHEDCYEVEDMREFEERPAPVGMEYVGKSEDEWEDYEISQFEEGAGNQKWRDTQTLSHSGITSYPARSNGVSGAFIDSCCDPLVDLVADAANQRRPVDLIDSFLAENHPELLQDSPKTSVSFTPSPHTDPQLRYSPSPNSPSHNTSSPQPTRPCPIAKSRPAIVRQKAVEAPAPPPALPPRQPLPRGSSDSFNESSSERGAYTEHSRYAAPQLPTPQPNLPVTPFSNNRTNEIMKNISSRKIIDQ